VSRYHRRIVIIAITSWAVSIALMFSQFIPMGDSWSDFLRAASVNSGALAACLTTVAVLPKMLREFYHDQITDYIGSFLAGWAAASEEEPEEPTKLRSVG
jgi:hypothetical protein